MEYIRNNEVLIEAFDDEMIAHHRGRGTTLLLNTSAAAILALLEQPHSREALITALAKLFQTDAPTIENDVIDTLDDLRAKGFICQS